MKKKRTFSNSSSYQYYLTVALFGSCACLHANPSGLQITHGEASLANPANHILEITSGKKAILEWESFSIANHEVTRFIQQDSSSAVLNRVNGDISKIFGTLESNGKIFLINPKGVIIGENARIDTGSFIASTFDILNTDFLENKDLIFSGDSDHAIVNLGTIRAKDGDIVLLAHRIRNEGSLEATNGQVSLNSGQEFLLKQEDSTVFIRPKLPKNVSKEMGIENTGTIKAIEAHLKADGNLFVHAINHSGVIEATGLENRGGRIHLVAEKSQVDVSGSMVANSGSNGGQIHIIGNQISLLDDTILDISAPNGGGEILVGGDFQGKNPHIPHAIFTTMQEKATIVADALASGDGGKVILWSDKGTDFFGKITSKGGPLGGNGGFVEISSPDKISFKGKVDLSSPFGKSGTLLLDPGDVSIGLGGTPTPLGSGGLCNGGNPVSLPNVTTTIIDPTALHDALEGCNVTIDTSNSGMSAPGTISIGLLAIPNSNTLTLRANKNINIFSIFQINPEGTPVNGNVLVMEAEGDVRIVGLTDVLPTAISHSGTGGGISITCDNLLLQGGIAGGADAFISISGTATTPKTLTINTTQDITLRGGINSDGSGAGEAIISTSASSGALNISAGGEILLNPNDSTAAIFSSVTDMNISAALISLEGSGELGSEASISVGSSPNITINAGTLSLATGDSTESSISTINGNISGAVQNLIINALGSQNSSISTTGSGNISFTSTEDNSTYLIEGSGTGTGSIQTTTGTISFNFSGATSGLSLLGVTSPAKILRTGGGVTGNITINATGSDSFVFLNSVHDYVGTKYAAPTLIQNQLGDINLTVNASTTGLNVGSYYNISSAQIEATSGNITINQTGGELLINPGDSYFETTLEASIQASGQIQILGSSSLELASRNTIAPNPITGFIQSQGNMSIQASRIVMASSAADIFINSLGTLSIDCNSIAMNSGVAASPSNEYITSSASMNINCNNLGLTAVISSGGTVDYSQPSLAYIHSDSDLNITVDSFNINQHYQQAGDNYITSNGPLTITGKGVYSFDIGNYTSNYTQVGKAYISSPSSITINAPTKTINIAGGSGANTDAFIKTTSSTTPSPLSITCGSLNLTGSPASAATSSFATLATDIGDITINPTGSITLQGGAADNNYATIQTNQGNIEIGQSVSSFGNVYLSGGSGANAIAEILTKQGNIDIGQSARSFGDLSLLGGSGANAYATIQTLNGNVLTLNSGGAVTLMGGDSPSGANSDASVSGISSSGSTALTVTGSSLTLQGGSGLNTGSNQAYFSLGNSPSGNTISIDITGNTNLIAGNGDGAVYAYISSLGNSPINLATGNLLLQGSQNPSTVYGHAYIVTGAGNISISRANNVQLIGGSASLADAYITNSSGDITLNCVTNNNGIINLAGGDSASSSMASIQAPSGSISITGYSLSVIGGEGTGTDQAFLSTGSASNPITLNLTGNLTVSANPSGNSVNSGYIAAAGTTSPITITCNNLTLGSSLANDSGTSYISTNTGNITIDAKGNILLQGGNNGSSYSQIKTNLGDILIGQNIASFGNISLYGGYSGSYATITTSDGDILIGKSPGSFGGLSLFGGNEGNSYATISAPNANILNVYGTGDHVFKAGMTTSSNSTDAAIQAASGSGNATLNITGKSLTLEGGSGDAAGSAQAYILWGNAPTGNTTTITITDDIMITAGSGLGTTNAFIESESTANNTFTISCRNLIMEGSEQSSAVSGYAAIDVAVGAITIDTTGDISLTGGNIASGASYAEINNLAVGTIDITSTGTVKLQGGSGNNSNAQILNNSLAGTGHTAITASGLEVLGGNASSGTGRGVISYTNNGNISIDCTSGAGHISFIGGQGTSDNSVRVQTQNGSIDVTGVSFSLIGGTGSGNTSSTDNNVYFSTNSANNPLTINLSGDLLLQGGSPANSDRSSVFMTTNSTTTASPLTISCHNLDLLGSATGTDQGLITLGTNVGDLSITTQGHARFVGGDAPVSYVLVKTTTGDISLTAAGDILLQGGHSSFSQANIYTTSTLNDITISGKSLTLTGGQGSSSFAQIGTRAPASFPFSGPITFPSITGNVSIVGGTNGGYALIGHGNPLATTTGIDISGDILFSSVHGDVYVSGGLQNPSFGQIGHINSKSASSILAGNITISSHGDVYVVDGGSPGHALIGLGGQSNTGIDQFTSDILISAKNVFLQSQALSDLSNGGHGIIGFLSPGTGQVTINSTTLAIAASQNIMRQANTSSLGPVMGIGSFVSSLNPASTATITSLSLTAGEDLAFTLQYSPSLYTGGIDFIGTYFKEGSAASGSSTIDITAGRNFFFDEMDFALGNKGYLQNTNPNNILSSENITIETGNGVYSTQAAGNQMSITSSGTLMVNTTGNPQGDVEMGSFVQSASGMTMIAGQNFLVNSFAQIVNTLSGSIILVADNLNPTAPDFNPDYGFTLLSPATISNQNNTGPIYLYSVVEFNTPIGDGTTPSINNQVFHHGTELVNSPTEDWEVYYPSGTLTTSSYRVFYKGKSPPIPPIPPSPNNLPNEITYDMYQGGLLISQMLYPQPEMLDGYMFWAESFDMLFNSKEYQNIRKRWGYQSNMELFPSHSYLRNRNNYFNFYELLLSRDIAPNKRKFCYPYELNHKDNRCYQETIPAGVEAGKNGKNAIFLSFLKTMSNLLPSAMRSNMEFSLKLLSRSKESENLVISQPIFSMRPAKRPKLE